MTAHLLLCASTTAFALALWTQPVSAEIPTDPWYVTVMTGATKISVYNPGVFDGGWEDGPDHSSWALQGGLRASRRFAVELATLRAANLSWHGLVGTEVSDTRFDVEATEVSAVATFPFAASFEVRARFGFANYDLAGAQNLTSAFVSSGSPALLISEPIAESGRGFLIGGSIGANLTPRWSLWLDYQSFDIDSSFLGRWAQYNDSTIDTFSLAASYRFVRERE